MNNIKPFLAVAAVLQWTRRVSTSQIIRGTLSNELLDVLVCPLSKDRLRYDEKNEELINDKLGVAYPIKDGIPQLAPEDGRLLQTGNNQSQWTNN